MEGRNVTGVHWQKGEMSWLVNWLSYPKSSEKSYEIGDIQQAKMHISFCDLRSGNFSTLFFYSIEGAAWL